MQVLMGWMKTFGNKLFELVDMSFMVASVNGLDETFGNKLFELVDRSFMVASVNGLDENVWKQVV